MFLFAGRIFVVIFPFCFLIFFYFTRIPLVTDVFGLCFHAIITDGMLALFLSFNRCVCLLFRKKGHIMPNKCPTLTKVCILPFKLLKLDDILYIKMFK